MVGVPRRLEKRKIDQEVKQPLPRPALRQLPGELVDLASAHAAGLEVVGQTQVDLLPRVLAQNVAPAHRLAKVVVEETDQAGAHDQRLLRGQEQRRPHRTWQRLAARAQQFQEFRLRQAPPGSPERGHRLAHQARSITLVVGFPTLQDPTVQVRQGLGGKVVVNPLVELFVGPKHSQFIQQCPQVERIGRLRGRCDPLDPILGKFLSELGQVVGDQLSPLVRFQRPHGKRGPSPLLKFSPGPAWQCREDHADVGRYHRREPHQVGGTVAVLQLIQGVQHQDHSPLSRRHV